MRTMNGLMFVAGVGVLALGPVACSGDDNNGGPVSSADAGPGDATTTLMDSSTVTATDASTDSGMAPNDSGSSAKDAVADSASDAAVPIHVVYLESNDLTANSILAYAQAADGTLSPLAGSPFPTGGIGVSNPGQNLGPDDTDQELILSPDNSKLFAVNAGSDTIAVFDVNADGSLTAIAGSPFASGGVDPVSVGLAGSFLYVVNQDEDPLKDAAASTPTYGAMSVAANGALAPVTGSVVAAGASPQVALTTANGKLLFGTDFMAPLASGEGPLRAFAINADGTLTAAPGTPMAIPVVDGGMPPGTPLALGLAVHPTQQILYVGFVLRSQIGVYTYDGTSGALTYVTEAPVSGAAPCWIRANAAGNRLYVSDTGTDSISVLDSTSPMAPTEMQNLLLADPGPVFDAGGMGALTSESYEENLSSDGKYLYVLSERLTTDPTVTTGNVLHVLSVAADGSLTETVPDVKLNVAVGVRPQGVVVR